MRHFMRKRYEIEQGRGHGLASRPSAPPPVPDAQAWHLQRTIGNRAARRQLRQTTVAHARLWRQPTGTLTNTDRRAFVQADTRYFVQAARAFATGLRDAAAFERVINAWYARLATMEGLIKDLGGDAVLTNDLRAAYTAAVRALMRQASRVFGRPEADLYRENSGRIPVWAWQQPHHAEAFISTPIPDGRSADPLTGEVRFTVGALEVTIKQDSPDPRVSGAETRLEFDPGSPRRTLDATGRVTTFSVPTSRATIQTFFGRGASSRSTSAKGRGTTREDVAGGQVTPHSTSLGFHEGHHGLDFVEFVESNAPPTFSGAVGQTNAQFNAAILRWNAAWAAYRKRAHDFTRRTD